MTWVIVSATVRKSQLEVENVWQMAWRDDEIPSPGDNVIRGSIARIKEIRPMGDDPWMVEALFADAGPSAVCLPEGPWTDGD